MATIQQLSPTSYSLTARGSRMVLEQTPKGWVMKTRNASTRVWGMGGESWKDFASLIEVEAHYKSWRGIAALVEAPILPPQ